VVSQRQAEALPDIDQRFSERVYQLVIVIRRLFELLKLMQQP
jgi:hypothetical protein